MTQCQDNHVIFVEVLNQSTIHKYYIKKNTFYEKIRDVSMTFFKTKMIYTPRAKSIWS